MSKRYHVEPCKFLESHAYILRYALNSSLRQEDALGAKLMSRLQNIFFYYLILSVIYSSRHLAKTATADKCVSIRRGLYQNTVVSVSEIKFLLERHSLVLKTIK